MAGTDRANQPSREAQELENLARAHLSELGEAGPSEAELKLLRAAPAGEWPYCGPSDRDDNPANDPSQADKKWGPKREIRAELIRWLAVNHEAASHVDPKGIQVHAAKITGALDLSYVDLRFPLVLLRCRLTGDASLQSAKMPLLSLRGSWVRAISADRIDVKGGVFLRQGFTAEGEVRLLSAQIGSNLECDGGAFKNQNGEALHADGIDVKGDVFLREGFTAEGEVRLLGARIGGDLDCGGGTFKNPSGKALNADGIDVKGDVFLRQGFTAEGEVRLLGARIGGDLDCSGGAFTNLVAHTATIKGNLFWSEVRNTEGEQRDVPSGSTATVSAPHRARSGFAGHLDLRNASVGALVDDELSWPDPNQGGTLLLDGFVYQRILAGPTDAPKRLQWLKRQQPFRPQPYRQLAKVLREGGGDDRGARRVLYEMERKRRAEKDHSTLSKVWGGVLRLTIGYGYYPQRGFGWLVVLGAWLFWTGYNHRAMAPTEEKAYSSFHKDGYPPPYYERFHPVIYSLENSFPFVKLGQTDKWSPDPADEGCPGCNGWASRLRYCVRSWSCGLRWFRWVQICAGWVLATFFVAGVTGVVRRE